MVSSPAILTHSTTLSPQKAIAAFETSTSGTLLSAYPSGRISHLVDVHPSSESCKLAQSSELRGEKRLSKLNRQAMEIQKELDRFKVWRTQTWIMAGCLTLYSVCQTKDAGSARREIGVELNSCTRELTGAMATPTTTVLEKSHGRNVGFELGPRDARDTPLGLHNLSFQHPLTWDYHDS